MSDTRIIEKMTIPYKITLYKNGENQNIYYYFTLNKKSHRGSTGTSNIDESRKKVTEIYYEISRGRREKGKVKITKFEELVKKFLNYKKEYVTQRTFSDYQRGSRFLLLKFKGKDVQTLCKTSVYQDYKTWRRNFYTTYKNMRVRKYKRNGKVLETQEFDHVGNVVINREITLLVSILRYGKISLDLFNGIDIHPYEHKLEEKRREIILSEDEFIKLRDYWMMKNPFYGHIINFLANSGVRYPSELNRLKWKDISFEENKIIIRNRKSRQNKLTSTVPMVMSLRNTLNWLRMRKNISTEPEDNVFVNSKGHTVKRIVRSFKKSLVDLDIDKNVTLYSFRHYYTSQMTKRNDIPHIQLAKVLGHSNTHTLQKFYNITEDTFIVNTFMKSDERTKRNEPQIPDKDHPINIFFPLEND